MKILDISNNLLNNLNGLSHLCDLNELWIGENKFSLLNELNKLSNLHQLHTLYAEKNPWCQNPRYFAIVQDYLPYLKQIDATFISL